MKINKKLKLILEGLLGLLIVQPLMWEGLKHGSVGSQMPVEFRIGLLIVFDLLAFTWFLHCRTPDKTAIKPKWW